MQLAKLILSTNAEVPRGQRLGPCCRRLAIFFALSQELLADRLADGRHLGLGIRDLALQRRKLRLHRLLPLRRISNERLGPGQLIHSRLAVQSQLKHLRDLCLDGFQTLIVPHPPGQALSQRDDKRIVHHRKRLRRDVGHIAATFRAGGHRRIHDRQKRIESVANNANVKTAAIAVGIFRAAKWTAIQRTTYLQHGITNRLRFQPANMSASQQAIVRIHLARLGRRRGRQLKRSRKRDFANQLFDRPPFRDEALGQVVE